MTDANIDLKANLTEQALPIGTALSNDQFTITGHLGAGGFGMTYAAQDNVLGRTVVIKECFPGEFCYREGNGVLPRNASYADAYYSIVAMFMREARSLAKLRHPNIVGVHGAFEEFGTAYMVLDLIDGCDLLGFLQPDVPKLSPRRVKDILVQLLDAVEAVHDIDLLHRDIAPDNIIIEDTGTPVLIDFGAARGDASRRTRAISALLVVKDGYSPQEFYVAGSEQTPSSDLYALGATFYHLIGGDLPPHSQTRLIEIAGDRPDPCRPLAGRIEGYDIEFLNAIDKAMRIHPGDRLQSAAQWKSLIVESEIKSDSILQSVTQASARKISIDLERSLTRLVEETNREVSKSPHIPGEIPKKQQLKPTKRLPKPDWIEEFNRESLKAIAEQKRRAQEKALARPDPEPATEPETSETPQDASPAERTESDNNWIGRAKDKQDQRLKELTCEIYGLQDEPELRIGSTTGEDPLNPYGDIDQTPDSVAAQKEPAPSLARIAACLIVCSCFLIFIHSG